VPREKGSARNFQGSRGGGAIFLGREGSTTQGGPTESLPWRRGARGWGEEGGWVTLTGGERQQKYNGEKGRFWTIMEKEREIEL